MTYLQFNACQQLRKANAHLCTSHELGLHSRDIAGWSSSSQISQIILYIYIYMIPKYTLNYFIASEEFSGYMHVVLPKFDPSDQMLLEGLVEAGRRSKKYFIKLSWKTFCRSHQQLVYHSSSWIGRWVVIIWVRSVFKLIAGTAVSCSWTYVAEIVDT